MPRKPGVYWTESWNPVTGCPPDEHNVVCRERCWARATAERFPQTHGRRAGKILIGFGHHDAMLPIPFSEIVLHPDRLDQPLHWKKPRVVAVCWMGDWMHDEVPTRFLDQMLDVMGATPQHTYLTLTKRPENLDAKLYGVTEEHGCRELGGGDYLPNLWMGATIWDQPSADRVLPIILSTPAAHRWMSYEPALGPLDLDSESADGLHALGCGEDEHRGHSGYPQCQGLDQVILGSESGPKRRPMPHAWARSIRDQCAEAGVPLYYKQAGENEDGTGRVVKEPTLDGKQHLDLAWEAER